MMVDSTGKTVVIGSGVLINPQFILTAGHINFNKLKYLGVDKIGFVSFADSSLSDNNKYIFDWTSDVISHPDTADFLKSLLDTTGAKWPPIFIDIGLIFFDKPITNQSIAKLPQLNILNHQKADDILTGVGYGYHLIADSTYTEAFNDGVRRKWSIQKLSTANDLWIFTECDTLNNFPFISIGDSGAPLFMNKITVVGIWSLLKANAKKPCPYSGWALRIDNPKVQAWIKETIMKKMVR